MTILSFGFKYGIPADADLVFDVRFLPNPYYVEELKAKTGNDKEVSDYVLKYEESGIFLEKLTDLITFLIPNYMNEGEESARDRHRLYRRKAPFRYAFQRAVPPSVRP